MRFEDYLHDCLKDPEFRKAWIEETADLDLPAEFKSDTVEITPSFDLSETLRLLDDLDDEDLNNIIKNKGIHPSVDEIGKTEIIFYEHKNKCPVQEFLETMSDDKLKAKTLTNIAKLSILSAKAPNSLSRYIDDGIFELRTKQSSNINRIFYFFVFGNKIIMTNGYIKKSQKMDMNEFKKAKAYMSDYLKK